MRLFFSSFIFVLMFSLLLFGQSETSGRFNGSRLQNVAEMGRPHGKPLFKLMIMHNNDGESQLINAGQGLEDFGGVARFKTVVDLLKAEAKQRNAEVLMLTSGDNYLAGPEFNASLSLEGSQNYYDSRAIDLIGYDALAIGNHDFDFGPDVLEKFIRGIDETQPPFLSANLDFSQEPGLQELKDQGRIAKSTIIHFGNEKVGIVGATTPDLPFISSPRKVKVDADVAGAIQNEVDKMEKQGINKIILISHLQSINEDLELAGMVSGIDIFIAGGGDELLANPWNLLIPGEEESVYGPYPLVVKDAAGKDVYVITTAGEYKYVGQLEVAFDPFGNVRKIGPRSGPVRIAGGDHVDAVEPDPVVQAEVVDPVVAYVEALGQNIIGQSEVVLDGRRGSVRTMETNEGNLIADALLWQANLLAASFGLEDADIALQNGGGIRNNTEIPAGEISELTTFDMLPFSNFVSIIPDIPAEQFKEILENAVSLVDNVNGRFAQISGFAFTWDPAGTAQVLDEDGNVTTPGSRVIEVILNDGTVIVENGEIATGAPFVNIATIDFLARGGDQYPYRGASFTSLGVTYQQALANYIETGLGGLISAADYPAGGEGRITEISANASKGWSGNDMSLSAKALALGINGNYPNPFNPATTIRYSIPQDGFVELSVYNSLGQKVSTLYAGVQTAGDHSAKFDAAELSSGIYLVRLKTNSSVKLHKMLLVK